jgi:hypothetical protein
MEMNYHLIVPKANKFISSGRNLARSCSDQNIFSRKKVRGRRDDLIERLCTETIGEKKTFTPTGLLQVLFMDFIKHMVLRQRGRSSLQKELLVREPTFMEKHGWY